MTYWLGSRSYRPATPVPCVSPFQTGLWMRCLWIGSLDGSKAIGSDHHQGLRIASGGFPHISCPMSLRGSIRTIPSLSPSKTCFKLFLKLKSLPENPAYSHVFESENFKLFEESASKLPRLGIRILPISWRNPTRTLTERCFLSGRRSLDTFSSHRPVWSN